MEPVERRATGAKQFISSQGDETAIIERYQRRESSVKEALIEMYLVGVSVRRVEDITQAPWGTRVSASTVQTGTTSKNGQKAIICGQNIQPSGQ